MIKLAKAVNAGFARLSQEVFQNVHKLDAHSKDQSKILQEMLQKAIAEFNERCYQLSKTQFELKQKAKNICRKQVAEEVKQALATEANLPLAQTLSKQLQEMQTRLTKFEVIILSLHMNIRLHTHVSVLERIH